MFREPRSLFYSNFDGLVRTVYCVYVNFTGAGFDRFDLAFIRDRRDFGIAADISELRGMSLCDQLFALLELADRCLDIKSTRRDFSGFT